MIDAKLPVQAVVVARCVAALDALDYDATRVLVNPAHGQVMPYVVVGDDDQNRSRMASDFSGDANTVEHVVKVYAGHPTEAKEIGAEILRRMTDRSSPPQPAGWDLYDFELASDVTLDERSVDTEDVWSRHMRFRLELEPQP